MIVLSRYQGCGSFAHALESPAENISAVVVVKFAIDPLHRCSCDAMLSKIASSLYILA